MMQKSTHLFEFHISNQSRQRYDFDQAIFTFNGNVIFANFHAARLFAQKMNAQRDLIRYPRAGCKSRAVDRHGVDR